MAGSHTSPVDSVVKYESVAHEVDDAQQADLSIPRRLEQVVCEVAKHVDVTESSTGVPSMTNGCGASVMLSMEIQEKESRASASTWTSTLILIPRLLRLTIGR